MKSYEFVFEKSWDENLNLARAPRDAKLQSRPGKLELGNLMTQCSVRMFSGEWQNWEGACSYVGFSLKIYHKMSQKIARS